MILRHLRLPFLQPSASTAATFTSKPSRAFASACLLVVVGVLAGSAGGCAGTDHVALWEQSLSQAEIEESAGNIEEAEIDYLSALERAREHLEAPDVSDSLLNIGSFYRRQGESEKAQAALEESLQLEQQLSGLQGEALMWRLAELAALHWDAGEYERGRPLVDRLRPLLDLHGAGLGAPETEFLQQVISAYDAESRRRTHKMNEAGEAPAP